MVEDIILTPELAELAGIHAGDGYLRYKGPIKEIDISGSVEEKDYYDFQVIPTFNRLFRLKIKGRFFPSRNTYGFRCHDSNMLETFRELGFPSGKKTTIVKIPKQILNSADQKIICAFLRGYFDTDGSLTFDKKIRNSSQFQRTYNYYPRLMFTTCSQELGNGFKYLTEKLGFHCKVYAYDPPKETESLKYKLQITGNKALFKWLELIGSNNHTKISRYEIWSKFGFCPPSTTYQERIDILKGRLDPHSFYMGP